MPTTRPAPLIFAIWPTTWPTAPAAPDTTTVPPAFIAPTSSRPKYAVMPGMPKTLSHCAGVPRRRSIFCSRPPGMPAAAWQYSCTPSRPLTTSPGAKAGSFDASTRPMPPARMTSPMPTGGM